MLVFELFWYNLDMELYENPPLSLTKNLSDNMWFYLLFHV